MKKVLFFVLILGMSVGVFAAPTVSSVGMSNTSGGGSGTNEIQKGETVYISGVASNITSGYVLNNFYNGDTADTVVGDLYIDYWDGIPGNGGSVTYGPSITLSNFNGSGADGTTFTAEFPMTTGTITDGTLYITIYFGLEENKRQVYNYGTAVESEIDVSSAPSGYFTYLTYVDDNSTQTPILTTPSSNSIINDSFNIEFNLPETAADGTVKLSLTRSSGTADTDDHVLIVTSEASGDHSFTLDATDLSSSSYVSLETGSVNSLVSGAVYIIKIEYQDLAQNTAADESNAGVTYSNDYIEMTGGDYNAGASFSPESTNNPYFWANFDKTGTGTAFTVTGIVFDGTGSMENSDVTAIKLWSSTSSTFDETATFLKEETTAYDPLNFTNLSISVSESGIYIYLTVDVSATAESTDNIGADIISNNDITTTAVVTGAPVNGGDHALPVTLTSFQAIKINDNVVLEWETESESNNSHWNVYRSPSANFGQAISINSTFIEAAGFSTEPVFYSFQDEYQLQLGATYWYWIECVAYNGLTDLMEPANIFLDYEYDDENENEIPEEFGLFQNMPNPFNPETNISFILEESSNVDLSVYNIKGQKIINLYNGTANQNEEKTFLWSGKDTNGKAVGSGIYFYILKTSDQVLTKKMLLTK